MVEGEAKAAAKLEADGIETARHRAATTLQAATRGRMARAAADGDDAGADARDVATAVLANGAAPPQLSR